MLWPFCPTSRDLIPSLVDFCWFCGFGVVSLNYFPCSLAFCCFNPTCQRPCRINISLLPLAGPPMSALGPRLGGPRGPGGPMGPMVPGGPGGVPGGYGGPGGMRGPGPGMMGPGSMGPGGVPGPGGPLPAMGLGGPGGPRPQWSQGPNSSTVCTPAYSLFFSRSF